MVNWSDMLMHDLEYEKSLTVRGGVLVWLLFVFVLILLQLSGRPSSVDIVSTEALLSNWRKVLRKKDNS